MAQAALQKARDRLSFTLLADPEIRVIRQYGVEHHKALGGTTGKFTVGGVPFVLSVSYQAMAIPTTLLVDEHGVVRWIDQSEDFRLRSDNERVLGAIDDVFS